MPSASTPPAVAAPHYYGYRLIAFAFVAQFVAVGVQNYAIGAFFVPMASELDWTRSEFTLARTLGQLCSAAVGYVVGTRVDRHGARPFMLAGVGIAVAALCAHAYVRTLAQWIVLNGIVLTTGAALFGNLVVNVTLARWFVELRGRAIALASMGVSFAGIALTPVATWVVDTVGWRQGWLWLALFTGVLALPAAAGMRRAPEDHGWRPDGRTAADAAAGRTQRAERDFALSMTRAQALRTPVFYLLVVAFGLFTVTIGVVLLQTIPYMTDAGFDRRTAALMITVASVPALVSKPLWGLLIDRVDGRPLAAASACVTALSLAGIVAAVAARDAWLSGVAFFCLGVGWGGMIPLQEVIWATFFGRRHLGSVRSAAMPFSLLVGAAAPLLVSAWFDAFGSYDGALLLVAGANLLSAVLMLLLRAPHGAAGPTSAATAQARDAAGTRVP
jgi:sugar phosphate permease